MVIDEKMQDEIRVTVIATGIGKIEQKKAVEASTVRPIRRFRPEGVVPAIDYDLLQVPPNVRQKIPVAEAAQGMEQMRNRPGTTERAQKKDPPSDDYRRRPRP